MLNLKCTNYYIYFHLYFKGSLWWYYMQNMSLSSNILLQKEILYTDKHKFCELHIKYVEITIKVWRTKSLYAIAQAVIGLRLHWLKFGISIDYFIYIFIYLFHRHPVCSAFAYFSIIVSFSCKYKFIKVQYVQNFRSIDSCVFSPLWVKTEALVLYMIYGVNKTMPVAKFKFKKGKMSVILLIMNILPPSF